jgi:hypothetical protein
MKWLSLQEPKKSRMRQYTTQTGSPGLDDRSLMNSGKGYDFRALNLRSRPLLTFPFDILHFPLIAPTQSQILPTSPVIHLNDIEPPK